MKILSVKVIREIDTDPDLSFLGEYSNTPTENSIDRGTPDRNQYRYFAPAMTGEETGNHDSPRQDYERMEAYNEQQWYMLGIRAEAEVQTSDKSVIQTIRSGGLWGIESDSGEDYLKEVETEELDELADELTAIGFSSAQIGTAIESRTRSE